MKVTDEEFIEEYFTRFRQAVFRNNISPNLSEMKDLLLKARTEKARVLFAGNGASAAIASHAALDFTKQAGVQSMSFNDAALLTALGNDYGYAHWVSKALEFYASPGDIIVLISSSGRSPNIMNAAGFAKQHQHPLITFSGFDLDNPLRRMGDINFWVDSHSYNLIESTHMFWLMLVCDLLIGKMDYPVS